ncbi:MAG: class I SAM-dependent methyltransferase [Candidatus Vogelbacteria bacterium]|nr:class I SAM-dependent methyltransferase [Candidatus Vogelbacteria bacterium]
MIDPKTSNSNSFYSNIARFYDFGLWFFGYKLAVYYFIGLLPFKKQDAFKVLDAGCGTGLYTLAILRRFPNASVEAFDLNNAMTEIMKITARRKKLGQHASIFNGDVTKTLKLESEQFDLIVTGGVLEYIDNIEIAVRNLAPYLKKGGYFLNTPVKDNWLGKIIAKLYRFSPHSHINNIKSFTSNGFFLVTERSFPIIKEAHLFRKQ